MNTKYSIICEFNNFNIYKNNAIDLKLNSVIF